MKLRSSLLVAAAVLSAGILNATPTLLNWSYKGDLGGYPEIETWIAGQLPEDAARCGDKVDVKDGPKTITLNFEDCDFVAIHWGGGQDETVQVIERFDKKTGAPIYGFKQTGGGVIELWALNGADSAEFTTSAHSGGGISWWECWCANEGGGGNEVPDGGSTVALLGLGLVGIAAGSRRFLRA